LKFSTKASSFLQAAGKPPAAETSTKDRPLCIDRVRDLPTRFHCDKGHAIVIYGAAWCAVRLANPRYRLNSCSRHGIARHLQDPITGRPPRYCRRANVMKLLLLFGMLVQAALGRVYITQPSLIFNTKSARLHDTWQACSISRGVTQLSSTQARIAPILIADHDFTLTSPTELALESGDLTSSWPGNLVKVRVQSHRTPRAWALHNDSMATP